MKLFLAMLVVVSSISCLDGTTIDICKTEDIKNALDKDRVVTISTPSSSEKNCKPSFDVPTDYTLDVSIVSTHVPKKTIGTEHHCVKVKFNGKEKVLDCSPDGSGVFSMSAYTKVIYRNIPRTALTKASVEIPTWNAGFRIMLELQPPLEASWSFDPSVTRVLVEEGQTKFTCAHDNARLVPIIYHDGEFDKADKDVLVLNARSSDSGLYACDFGDKKDNKVNATTDRFRLVVAGKELLTSQREIFNASVGDRFPLYCSVKFYVGSMKEMKSSDWDRIHGILSAQYREDSSPIPPWLSLDRVSWIDVTDTNNPRLVAVATGNLSLHTNDASGSSSSSDDGSGDLINVGDISMPYFALSKIIDLAVREEDAGKTLTYRCHYDDMDSAIIGGIAASHVKVHVNALPTSAPLIDIDLTPTQIAIIVIVIVFLILVVAGIALCCIRGVPGRGKNRLREDNPLEGSNGWVLRAETEPLNGAVPSPTTPNQDGVLYQPRGPDPQGLDDDNPRSDSPNGEVFFGSTFSASPPKLPSPNANGAPYSSGLPNWPSLSRKGLHRSLSDAEGDHDVSLNNDTYGVVLKSPNNVVVAT